MSRSEHNLYVAVVMQALEDLAGITRRAATEAPATEPPVAKQPPPRIRENALRWLCDDDDYPFSFRDCCRVLRLNPVSSRRHLLAAIGLKGFGPEFIASGAPA